MSDKHANFIQASPDATSSDVIGVMTKVQDAVREKFGVELRSEVRLVGFPAATVGRFAAHSHSDPAVSSASAGLADLLGEPA